MLKFFLEVNLFSFGPLLVITGSASTWTITSGEKFLILLKEMTFGTDDASADVAALHVDADGVGCGRGNREFRFREAFQSHTGISDVSFLKRCNGFRFVECRVSMRLKSVQLVGLYCGRRVLEMLEDLNQLRHAAKFGLILTRNTNETYVGVFHLAN